jgi:hypothetical protein
MQVCEQARRFGKRYAFRTDARYRLGLAHLKNGNVAAATEQHDALKTLNPEAADQLQQQIDGRQN